MKQSDRIYKIEKIVCMMLISIFEWHQLDISCNLEKEIHVIDIKCIILNICIIMIINLIIYILTNRLWLTMIMSETMWTIISIVNYYVIQYHGMPLTVTEMKNFKTAIAVLGSYDFCIDIILVKILSICVLVVLYSFFEKKHEKNTKRSIKTILLSSSVILLCGTYLFWGLCGQNPIKPKKTIGWSWKEAYGKYGYLACVIEDFYFKNNIFNKPENYSLDEVEIVCNKYLSEKEINNENDRYPDIIFIVNESFYDLKHLVDFETDVDYLKNIHDMDNLISGYAVSPTPYGGTNSSEYELLTSNSLYLMNSGVTPFNVIDLKGATSVVSHLKSLGYSTLGTHTESGINYNRVTGYNDLGFDTVKFEEEYENLEYYYGRWYETDSSVYKNIEKWYEEMGDEPRFLYLLTIQNHGNWDLNKPEYDKVHVVDSKFEITDVVNEYLTSISLSDEAFFEITEYFKNVDRPVIVCMVGDHCPSFAGEIVDKNLNEDEKALKLRETPIYIWANFEIDKKEIGSVSMPFVMPLLLETADVPLSSYYEYILDLNMNVPIITAYGKYFDSNYNCFPINEGQYSGLVNEYFSIEYSSLGDKKQKNEAFFE